VRLELAGQGTQVVGLMPGLIGTQTLYDFADKAGIEFPEGAVTEPDALVELALDGLEAGEIEIADALGLKAKATLAGPPQALSI
jgi:short-subunit dehydrogenase